MTRAIKEWPERFTDPYSGITYSDFDRGRLHGGVMVCPNRCWPLLDEKWEAMISEGPTPAGEEFTITTDPTEAPADALLEAAGYYVEPGSSIVETQGDAAQERGDSMIHFHTPSMQCRGWWSTFAGMVRNGWDPYSWDVKPTPPTKADFQRVVKQRDTLKREMARLAMAALDLGKAVAKANAPCSVCNGTGQVHGALGVGIMWPCECRGGV